MRAPRPLVLTAILPALLIAGCTTETPPVATTDPVNPPLASAPASPPAISGQDAPGLDTTVDPAAVLTVEDQTSEGPTVNVEAAAATDGGFVVVSSDGGRNVLGTGLVPAGTEPQPVQVSLAEEPTEQLDLLARLYADTDGDGFFSAPDQPISDGKDDDSGPAFDGVQREFTFQGKKVVNS